MLFGTGLYFYYEPSLSTSEETPNEESITNTNNNNPQINIQKPPIIAIPPKQ